MTSRLRPDYTAAPMGERALLIKFPNRISTLINAHVHHTKSLMQRARLPGLVDIVPAYASLLVTFDSQVTDHSALLEELHKLLPKGEHHNGARSPAGHRHIVPVQYGGDAGPDLEEVARLHDLSPADVVRMHSARDYRVNFLGFLPGFAYLSSVSARIATPRLATPRTRVNEGSVGIAGGQTAIYPLSSPGGWRLLGRTSEPVWDLSADPPARLRPGDFVRFAESGYQAPIEAQFAQPPMPQLPALEVLASHGMCTIQDLGRAGYAHIGVSEGGAFDKLAAVRANALVGNAPDAALLELLWTGPSMRALRNVSIALDGADLGCRVDGALVPTGLSWFVRQGSEVRFTGRGRWAGVRGYLAVSGGFDVPVVLGSRATSTLAHFGGYCGRPISPGDVLGICTPSIDPVSAAGRYWLGKSAAVPATGVTLRYLPFNGRGAVSRDMRRAFRDCEYRLSDRADRMGFRFTPEDAEVRPTGSPELISFGVVRGAIQIPPDGNPVVLNVDHQTTGGYPLVGVVIRADWPLLAQLAPGRSVRFEAVTAESARTAYSENMGDLSRGLAALGRPLPPGLD